MTALQVSLEGAEGSDREGFSYRRVDDGIASLRQALRLSEAKGSHTAV